MNENKPEWGLRVRVKDYRVSWKSHSEEAKRTWGRSEPCNVLVEEYARQREHHVAKALDWECAWCETRMESMLDGWNGGSRIERANGGMVGWLGVEG